MRKISIGNENKQHVKSACKPVIKLDLIELDEYGESVGLAAKIDLGEEYILYWLTASDGDNEYARPVEYLSVEEIAGFVQTARKIAIEHGCQFDEPDDEFYQTLESCDRTDEEIGSIKALLAIQRT
jgi:hypothetical protein